MKMLRKIIKSMLMFIGKFWAKLYRHSLSRNIAMVKAVLYSAWISREFKTFGPGTIIQPKIHLIGGKHISVGSETYIGARTTVTARDKYGADFFHPHIIIGNNVSIGDDSHVTAINRIEIGNNVLTGKKVTITDNSHGENNFQSLSLPPLTRPLYSAGPVIIEDNVWIGDKATILPNIRIGKNAIVGANSVVTKDIPANCIAGGIPAVVIRKID